MGERLPPDEMKLYHRVDEVLHYIWDPIGVAGVPEARDEYYSYLPRVYSMLQETSDGKNLKEYLRQIECEHMGLDCRNGMEERICQVIDILLHYRKLILNK